IREMDFTTAGYLAANPAFPHQTTADQFFTPDQFDAYRLLGYESAINMIQDLDLKKNIGTPSDIVKKYKEIPDKPQDAHVLSVLNLLREAKDAVESRAASHTRS